MSRPGQAHAAWMEPAEPGAYDFFATRLDGGRADAVAFEFSAGILSLAGRHADAYCYACAGRQLFRQPYDDKRRRDRYTQLEC